MTQQRCSQGHWTVRPEITMRSSGKAAACTCTSAPAAMTHRGARRPSRRPQPAVAGGLRRPRPGGGDRSVPARTRARSPARSSAPARPHRDGRPCGSNGRAAGRTLGRSRALLAWPQEYGSAAVELVAAGVGQRLGLPGPHPSTAARAAIPSPAAGSAHHQPRAALTARPTSSTADSHAHSDVWLASDTAARDPRTGATLRLARASPGITTSDSPAKTMPGMLASGSTRPSRSRVLSNPT